MPRSLIWLLAGLIALAVAAPWARAQDEIPAPPQAFTTKTLQDALKESIETKKFLLVYPHFDKDGWREMDEKTWTNPTLRTWIMWKGIAVRVDPKESPQSWAFLQRAISMGNARAKTTAFPHLFIFCDGKLVKMYPDPDFQGYLTEPNVLFGGLPDAKMFYPKASQILFTLDLLGDKLKSTNPVWMMQHEMKNPMPPEPPRPPPLCRGDDGAAPVIWDPEPGEGGKVDVLAMVDRARDLVAHNEMYDATGVYTWLWERGEQFDPSFRAARMSFIAAEIGDLARKRDGTMRRFIAVRQVLADRQPWWSWDDLLEWTVLSRALGRESEVLEYLAQYTVDEQEQTMMPFSHRSIYQALSNVDSVIEPLDTTKPALDRVRVRSGKLQTARPAVGTPPKEWAEAVALRRRLLIDEGSRLHASLIKRGDFATASEVSRLVLSARDDASARLSLITTAIIAGAPLRAEHRQWLAEAEAGGAIAPAQHRRVQNSLAPNR